MTPCFSCKCTFRRDRILIFGIRCCDVKCTIWSKASVLAERCEPPRTFLKKQAERKKAEEKSKRAILTQRSNENQGALVFYLHMSWPETATPLD